MLLNLISLLSLVISLHSVEVIYVEQLTKLSNERKNSGFQQNVYLLVGYLMKIAELISLFS